jgi:hypothetical protein
MYLTARANSLLYQAQVFAVRRAQFAVRRSRGAGLEFGVAGRCRWRHTALTITLSPKLKSIPNFVLFASLW